MSSELKNRWIAIEKLWDQINIYDGPDTFLSTSSAAGQPAALLYAAHFAESEICNGGFKQQFSNSTGILSPEAVQGFQLIGITRQHRYSSPQLKHWATPFPRERKIRQEILKSVSVQTLRNLDKQFFELIETENGGFLAASDAFVINMNNEAE